jgi:enoyl-CoA hydratase/carnithine racemase
MQQEQDEIVTEVHGRVSVITINRVAAKNAINGAVAEGLVAALGELDARDDLFAGVICGAGGTFSSGMDLKAFMGGGVPSKLGTVFEDGSKKPLIAAVEGFALAGGLELALTCDLIVAARGAKLGIPEVRVGLFAGGGGLFRLGRRLPYSVAMQMAITGASITAEEGHHHGLVSKLTDPGAAAAAAVELAESIARNAPLAVAASKEVVRRTAALSEEDAWDLQKPYFRTVFGSNDAKEGPRAFAEKRQPSWTGT